MHIGSPSPGKSRTLSSARLRTNPPSQLAASQLLIYGGMGKSLKALYGRQTDVAVAPFCYSVACGRRQGRWLACYREEVLARHV
jgi:hypothetical protein